MSVQTFKNDHATGVKNQKKSKNLPFVFSGWDGRIRTYDLLLQRQAPYHLATSHYLNCNRGILPY